MTDFSSLQIQTGGNGCVIGLRVTPGGDETVIDGPYGDRIKLSVCEPAQDGRANEELTTFLSSVLRCSPQHIEIISGATSRDKRIRVHGRTPQEIRVLLSRSFNSS